jgi:hypothetical protein
MMVWSTASLMASLLLSNSQSPAPSPSDKVAARFPIVRADNLEKREFNLPAGFEGDRNLVLVAFEREQQKDVDTWLREMKRFEESDTGFRYYELPTIQRPNAFMRWFIDNGMRHGIPDRAARQRTITLYIEKKPFCDALRIADQKKIYALLVDREGKILWRSEGLFDEAKGASLRQALGETRHG